MNSRLVEMITRRRLQLRDGQWIDTYNQITDPDCAGTIIAGINAKNHYYVMEEMKDKTDIEDNIQVAGTIHPGQNGIIYNTNGVAPAICAGEGVKCNTKIEEQIVLGWTRDHKNGEVVNRHPVNVANAVTAVKRDNT